MKFTNSKFAKFFKKLTENEAFNVSIALIILFLMPVLSILANSDLQEYHYYDYEETITTYGEDEEIVSDNDESEDDEYVITTITDETTTIDESSISTSSEISSCDEKETTETTTTYENFKVENKDNVVLNNKAAANDINKAAHVDNVVAETHPTVTTTSETTTETTTAVVTTTTTTENIETTTTTTASIKEEETTTTTEETTVDDDTMEGLTYLKSFSRGTYYSGQYYSSNPSTVKGGSGRTLVDCSIGDGTGVKGSIASNYIYRNYGYERNGGRTLVYIECEQYPDMNGTYYLDDSQRYNNEVVDFYYYYNSNCPFQYQGVITVEVWLVD